MRKSHESILAVLAAGLLIGAIAASHAKLPPPPAKSDAEKAAEAEKAAAAKAKEAAELAKAQDRAVANYKKNKGASMAPEQEMRAPLAIAFTAAALLGCQSAAETTRRVPRRRSSP